MDEPRVIIERWVLRDSGDNIGMQRVATVYLGMMEHRVYAPSRASGDPAQWKAQLVVHAPVGFGEITLPEPNRSRIIEAMLCEFQRQKTDTAKAESEALYCEAQICMRGDVQSSDGTPFDPTAHCTKCGSKCIDHCFLCNVPIRGQMKYSSATYECPSFCHGCGKPYPWMEEKLKTARELLFHDDQLTYEERTELWDLLQYVMSNPKDGLAPGKLKLISIKIKDAAGPIKDFITDIVAKYGAEMSKP